MATSKKNSFLIVFAVTMILDLILAIITSVLYAKVAGDSNNDSIKTILNVFIPILFILLAFGTSTGVIGIIQLKKKAMSAEIADNAKADFLSRMSHQMRIPMTAVMGLCRMAKETDDPKKIDEYLDNILMASVNLKEILDEVIDLSRAQSGKTKLEYNEIDFYKEMGKLEQMVFSTAHTKDQSLTFDIDNNIPVKLVCDVGLLKQILLNIISNAIKFTPDGGEIKVFASALEVNDKICNIEWRVRDNGIGIADKNLEKIFHPFERGDNAQAKRAGGTGLGLSLSTQYIKLMGGSIRVETQLKKGSEFIFNTILHLPDALTAVKSDDDEIYEKPDLKGCNILLVEDAELNQLIAVDLFEGYGATVETASNGLEGYQKFCRNYNKYDLIFMDIQMPIMDGYEATMKIRTSGVKTALTIPIIAMTADVFKEDIEKAMNAGMNAHVGKPFDNEQIERAIYKVRKEQN